MGAATGRGFGRGADLKVVDERTVALVPHGVEAAKDAEGKPLPYAVIHFVFGADGKLSERQVVEMPSKKVILSETASGWGKVNDASAPELTPDVKNFVVLPLPYRSPEHVRKTLKMENKRNEDLRFEDGLALFAAYFGSGNGNEANNVFRQCFHGRNQRQIGFYVLLAACGNNLDAENGNVLAEHPNEPLAQYLAMYSSPVLRKHASQWAVSTEQWKDGFLQHLAVTHAILQRWQNKKIKVDDEAELKRTLDYVRRNKNSAFAWALLGLMQDRANEEQANKKDVSAVYRSLADAWLLFEDMPGINYAARYEHARCLWKAGEREAARKQFRELYEKTIKEDILPPVDADFRQALQGDGKEPDQWSELLRETAKRMVEKKQRVAILVMARQCWQLGDQPSAGYLLTTALEGISEEKPRQLMILLAIDFLMETSQWIPADQLVQQLLADPKLAKKPGLWRLAATLAEKRDMKARELECLERALDAEYQELPDIINLEAVRRDYGRLLRHYENLAEMMVTLKTPLGSGFPGQGHSYRRPLASAGRQQCRRLPDDGPHPANVGRARPGLGLSDDAHRSATQRVRSLAEPGANAEPQGRRGIGRPRLCGRLRSRTDECADPLGPRSMSAAGRQARGSTETLPPVGRKRLAAAVQLAQGTSTATC